MGDVHMTADANPTDATWTRTSGRSGLAALLAVTALTAALLFITSLWALPASAVPFGRVLHSGNPGVNGGATCASCHGGGGVAPAVEISGPSTVAPGATANYTLTITGGPAVVGGFNISTGDGLGTLTPGDSDSQALNGEITHSAPKPFSGDMVTFDFEWTAPAETGAVTMYAAGLSANGANGNSGDAVGTTTFEVTVAQANPAVPGADAPIEVAHVVSCLAENGRVDTNIVNTGAAAAVYRIEFQGLSARETTVDALDWWRMPITGRPDGTYQVTVKRDSITVSTQTVTVSCDSVPPVIAGPDIQVVNACRDGNGYVLFQFLNATDATWPLIIRFEGVPGRSTTAAAYGQTVRAVTGRPDGVYTVDVFSGFDPVASFPVTVACD